MTTATRPPAAATNALLRADTDAPLRADIRLLGALLGETIKTRDGIETFATIESVRQLAVRASRDDDSAARKKLASLLNRLSRDRAVSVVRAFSYFLHLTNIAEDRHQSRRTRETLIAGGAPAPGSMRHALERLKLGKVRANEVSAFFAHANLVPVLTAHPTEVQRKSILDAELEIARLIAAKDSVSLTPDERAEIEVLLSARVLAMWQTRMLRPVKLTVADEIENGL